MGDIKIKLSKTAILAAAAEIHAIITNYTQDSGEHMIIMQIVGSLLAGKVGIEEDEDDN